ncbi:MAG TPA: HAMP domain-containing sensor histidine kinase [Longimicrobiaceae bacterium]|nr:HAMP domain-containing sensor histidine kinase [Longimicrobiaceae bacterium]
MTVEDRSEGSGCSLADAVRLATEAPDAEHALEGILEAAMASAGALAGALVEAGEPRARTLRGWAPERFAALLAPGGAVAEALARREEWIDRPLLVPAPAARTPAPDGTPAALLVLPLHVRALAAGAMVLALPDGTPEDAWETARGCAGVAALVLEHDRAFEEARTARQMRDHFLTALNHEIRTPALALTLNADVLRSYDTSSLPAHIAKVVASTRTAINTIVQVLEGVLQLGDREAADSGAEVVQPREAVLQLLRRVEPAADRKQLPISLRAQRDLPPLQTDPARFSKILLHLLSNAIKYTSEGGIEVRVERTARWSGGRRRPFLAVRVVDSGRGIARDVLEQMMEPFTQVGDSARTDSHVRGVGLGLALSRRLARSLGGDLLVESEPGRGTSASLFLPYHR